MEQHSEEEHLAHRLAKLAYSIEFSRAIEDETASTWNAQLKKWFKTTACSEDEQKTARTIIQNIAALGIGKDPFANVIVVLRIVSHWPHQVDKNRCYNPALCAIMLAIAKSGDAPLDVYPLLAKCDDDPNTIPLALSRLHTLELTHYANNLVDALVEDANARNNITHAIRLLNYDQQDVIAADLINNLAAATTNSRRLLLKRSLTQDDTQTALSFIKWTLTEVSTPFPDDDAIKNALLSLVDTCVLSDNDVLHCAKTLIHIEPGQAIELDNHSELDDHFEVDDLIEPSQVLELDDHSELDHHFKVDYHCELDDLSEPSQV